ncbi:aspartate kinase [Flammeovirga aprica]|uniref:Aspartate kinase n=1 Tax=Flammeovirga aprica JL-4 TaxID=694437 RepID=A0A7X9S049_9BACT|nr:aspartate kinase [Flammeovirga aprica]NME71943.1 aspartate kinase [Flammeovirga aprica JL-4]
MITIAEAVEEIVRKSPFLEEAIVDGIVNYTGLARQIMPEVEDKLMKDVQIGGVVMAIQRLRPKLSKLDIEHEVLNYLKKMGEIIVRSDLVDYTFKNSPSLIGKQQELLRSIQGEKDVFQASSKGVYETNIVTSKKMLDQLLTIFEGEEIISRKENLASLTMRLPQDNTSVPGIYYYLLKKIAWEGINIVEVISTTNEFTLILAKRDVNRTFSLLHNLVND